MVSNPIVEAQKKINEILKNLEIELERSVASIGLNDVEITSIECVEQRFLRTVKISMRDSPEIVWE